MLHQFVYEICNEPISQQGFYVTYVKTTVRLLNNQVVSLVSIVFELLREVALVTLQMLIHEVPSLNS